MKKNTVSFCCLLLTGMLPFTACLHPRYVLNNQEKAYKAKAKRSEEISIHYDRPAVYQLRNNGTYTVRIDEHDLGYAYLDTSVFKARAVQIAGNVSRFMNFKEHHAWISVVFNGCSNTERPDAFGSSPRYYYVIRMPIANLQQAVLVSNVNTFQRRRG